jgi:hypothetical protein
LAAGFPLKFCVLGEDLGSVSQCTLLLHFGRPAVFDAWIFQFCSFKATGGIERDRWCSFACSDLEFKREIHTVSKPRETSIGPCRGLWLGSIPPCCGVVLSTLGCSHCGLLVSVFILLCKCHRMGHAQFPRVAMRGDAWQLWRRGHQKGGGIYSLFFLFKDSVTYDTGRRLLARRRGLSLVKTPVMVQIVVAIRAYLRVGGFNILWITDSTWLCGKGSQFLVTRRGDSFSPDGSCSIFDGTTFVAILFDAFLPVKSVGHTPEHCCGFKSPIPVGQRVRCLSAFRYLGSCG